MLELPCGGTHTNDLKKTSFSANAMYYGVTVYKILLLMHLLFTSGKYWALLWQKLYVKTDVCIWNHWTSGLQGFTKLLNCLLTTTRSTYQCCKPVVLVDGQCVPPVGAHHWCLTGPICRHRQPLPWRPACASSDWLLLSKFVEPSRCHLPRESTDRE